MSDERDPAVACEPALLEFVRAQRWFAGREAEATAISIVNHAELRARPTRAIDALTEVRFGNGENDRYQLLLGTHDPPHGDRPHTRPPNVDAFTDASLVEQLLELVRERATIPARDGVIDFCTAADGFHLDAPHEVRALGLEQSNSSIVVDETLFVKLYRRIEAGVNPELELLRFLGSCGFSHVPTLVGWWSYSGNAMSATLGLVQNFLPGAIDGWTMAIAEVTSQPSALLARAARLGEVIGLMHRTLASDSDDPAFAPEESSPEALALLNATLDDEIESVFDRLPEGNPAVAPLIGHSGAARELLRSLATTSSVGRVIRNHGDLHLGQVLWACDDWFVVDFEGEPLRTVSERRAKRSPLRDVAGMLRSFAYAMAQGHGSPAYEEEIRTAFLESYIAGAQPSGVLPPVEQMARLITLFELERTIYELRYELAHRPDWAHVPVAGLLRLLEQNAV